MVKAILATLSGIALVAFTYLCITVAQAVHTNSAHVARILMDSDQTISRVNTTLEKINGKNGLLQESAKTVVRARDLITDSQILIFNENKVLADQNKAITSTLNSIDSAVHNAAIDETTLSTSTVQTLATATNTLVDVQADVVSANETVKALTTTTQSANQTVIDADATVQSLHATAVDLQDEVHKLTHPTKKKLGFWGTVWAGAQIVHKLSPPLF